MISNKYVLLAVAAATGLAMAQSAPDKPSPFTTDASWQVPGKALKQGSYQIRVDDSMSDRSILQILSSDGKQVYATFLSVPNRQLHRQGDSNFVFWNNVDRKKQVVRAWFAPRESYAHEFVYEKKLAAKIATEAKEIVPAVDPASEPSIKGRKLSAADMRAIQLWALSLDTASPDAASPEKKHGIQAAKLDRSAQDFRPVPREPRPTSATSEIVNHTPLPSAPARPTPVEATHREPARAQVTALRQNDTQATRPSGDLPHTASNIPLIALVGILLLATSLALRYQVRG